MTDRNTKAKKLMEGLHPTHPAQNARWMGHPGFGVGVRIPHLKSEMWATRRAVRMMQLS
jgi:hypothetical protein